MEGYLYQHFKCLIDSSDIVIFLMELSTISRITSWRSSIERACWSCSTKYSISSINSRFTCSYSAIRAKTLSISKLRFLFFSRDAKCSFLNFYSSAIKTSRSLSWVLIAPSTLAILSWISLPLLFSPPRATVFLSSSFFDLAVCCSRFL